MNEDIYAIKSGKFELKRKNMRKVGSKWSTLH